MLKHMNTKPVLPKMHGVIDYSFGVIQAVVPAMLKLSSQNQNVYRAIGTGFAAMNMVTDTPVGVKKYLSFKTHQKADATFLVGLSLLTFANGIRNHKRSLYFHLAFLGTAIFHYALTDYNAKNHRALSEMH
jgi:hypothetical protein